MSLVSQFDQSSTASVIDGVAGIDCDFEPLDVRGELLPPIALAWAGSKTLLGRRFNQW